jgi:hypothetical protein
MLPQKRRAEEDTNKESQSNKRQKPNPTSMLKSLISHSSVSPQYVIQQALQKETRDAKKRKYEAGLNEITNMGIDTFEEYFRFTLYERKNLLGLSFSSLEHLFKQYNPFTMCTL